MSCVQIQKGKTLPVKEFCTTIPEVLCVGFNWGAIHSSQLLGLITKDKPVNLDASVALFGENGKLFDMVYYKRLHSDDRSISHSGDDQVGDVGEDDGLDNEVIKIEMEKVSESIATIAIFLTSNVDFSQVPYTRIRFFTPMKNGTETVYAEYNISTQKGFKKKLSMIFGLLKREGKEWSFQSIGEAMNSDNINDAIDEIQANWLG